MKTFLILVISLFSFSASASECWFRANDGRMLLFPDTGESEAILAYPSRNAEICDVARTDLGSGMRLSCVTVDGFMSMSEEGVSFDGKTWRSICE